MFHSCENERPELYVRFVAYWFIVFDATIIVIFYILVLNNTADCEILSFFFNDITF